MESHKRSPFSIPARTIHQHHGRCPDRGGGDFRPYPRNHRRDRHWHHLGAQRGARLLSRSIAPRSDAALKASLGASRARSRAATATRDEISSRELVPGDVLHLETVGQVAADARLIENINLALRRRRLPASRCQSRRTCGRIRRESARWATRSRWSLWARPSPFGPRQGGGDRHRACRPSWARSPI